MLDEHAPGYEEYRETYDEAATRRLLSPEIRAELGEFDDQDLLTVDVFFLWRKVNDSGTTSFPAQVTSHKRRGI